MHKKLFLLLFLISFAAQSQNFVTGTIVTENEDLDWVALYQLIGSKQIFIKKIKNTLTLVCYLNYLIKDRWPNWIRRSATNREIPDSSSGRSTKKDK